MKNFMIMTLLVTATVSVHADLAQYYLKGTECQAVINNDLNACEASDCKARLSANDSICKSADCKAAVHNNIKECTTSICQAEFAARTLRAKASGAKLQQVLSKLSEKVCKRGDAMDSTCKAFIFNNPGLCKDFNEK